MKAVQATALSPFEERVKEVVEQHAVVTSNSYTKWFAEGRASREEVRHLAVQFSVFSHFFVEAQLRKVINAPSIEAYRAGKEILMNELGVIFRPRGAPRNESGDGFAPDHVGTEGSVEGSSYHSAAAHSIAKALESGTHVGRLMTTTTLRFAGAAP